MKNYILLSLIFLLFSCEKEAVQPEPEQLNPKLITLHVDLREILGQTYIVEYQGNIDTIHEDWTKEILVEKDEPLLMITRCTYNGKCSASMSIIGKVIREGSTTNARTRPIELFYKW